MLAHIVGYTFAAGVAGFWVTAGVLFTRYEARSLEIAQAFKAGE
jgi:hypothetical protein